MCVCVCVRGRGAGEKRAKNEEQNRDQRDGARLTNPGRNPTGIKVTVSRCLSQQQCHIKGCVLAVTGTGHFGDRRGCLRNTLAARQYICVPALIVVMHI